MGQEKKGLPAVRTKGKENQKMCFQGAVKRENCGRWGKKDDKNEDQKHTTGRMRKKKMQCGILQTITPKKKGKKNRGKRRAGTQRPGAYKRMGEKENLGPRRTISQGIITRDWFWGGGSG